MPRSPRHARTRAAHKRRRHITNRTGATGDTPCRITSARCSVRNAFKVSEPGSPGPAPTSVTEPLSHPFLPVRREGGVEFAMKLSGRVVGAIEEQMSLAMATGIDAADSRTRSSSAARRFIEELPAQRNQTARATGENTVFKRGPDATKPETVGGTVTDEPATIGLLRRRADSFATHPTSVPPMNTIDATGSARKPERLMIMERFRSNQHCSTGAIVREIGWQRK